MSLCIKYYLCIENEWFINLFLRQTEQCHYTYVTKFTPTQEQICEETFQKKCQISFKQQENMNKFYFNWRKSLGYRNKSMQNRSKLLGNRRISLGYGANYWDTGEYLKDMEQIFRTREKMFGKQEKIIWRQEQIIRTHRSKYLKTTR